jgi:hypothetical protein
MSARDEAAKLRIGQCLHEIQTSSELKNKSHYAKKYKLNFYHIQAMIDLGYVKTRIVVKGKHFLEGDILVTPNDLNTDHILIRSKEINPIYAYTAKMEAKKLEPVEVITEPVVKLNIFRKIAKWFS